MCNFQVIVYATVLLEERGTVKIGRKKEVAGIPLTATGPFNSGSLINKMVTDMTKAISIRFADLGLQKLLT